MVPPVTGFSFPTCWPFRNIVTYHAVHSLDGWYRLWHCSEKELWMESWIMLNQVDTWSETLYYISTCDVLHAVVFIDRDVHDIHHWAKALQIYINIDLIYIYIYLGYGDQDFVNRFFFNCVSLSCTVGCLKTEQQNVWLDCPLDVITSNWFAKLSSYFVISLSFSCLCSKEHFCLSLPDHLTAKTKFFYPCPIKHLHSIVLFF